MMPSAQVRDENHRPKNADAKPPLLGAKASNNRQYCASVIAAKAIDFVLGLGIFAGIGEAA